MLRAKRAFKAHPKIRRDRVRSQPGVFYKMLGIIALIFVACTNEGGESGSAPASRPASLADESTNEDTRYSDSAGIEVTDNTPVSYLQSLVGGNDTMKALSLEIDNRTGDCMRAEGFDYVPLVSPATVVLDDYQTVSQWREYVYSRGYGLYWYETEAGHRATEEIVDEIEMEGTRSIPTADRGRYMAALVGDASANLEALNVSPSASTEDVGGCVREALIGVREERGLPPLSPELLAVVSATDFRTVPAYQEATDRWSACMAEVGFDYDDPEDALRGFAQDHYDGIDRDPEAAERRFTEELAVATADLDCQLEHVLATRLSLEREALRELTEQFPELAPYVNTLGG